MLSETRKIKEQISEILFTDGVKEKISKELYRSLWRMYDDIENATEARQALKIVEYSLKDTQ